MKNRHLYLMLLLAALALLPARVALASCEPVHPASMSTCCEESCAAQPGDELAAVCALGHCAVAYAQAPAQRSAAASAVPVIAHAPPPARPPAMSRGSGLPPALAPAHPAHTRLVYVLQRLLI